MTFELLVATRYLRAKRKQAISVVTLIAVLGVAAGVGALVVAMAVSEGQRRDIRHKLLGAQAHVTIYGATGARISNYRNVAKQIEQIEGVVGAAPQAEQGMAIPTSGDYRGVRVTGIIPELDAHVSALRENVIEGDFDKLKATPGEPNNSIAVGKQLAEDLGLKLGDNVKITSAATTGGPNGPGQQSLNLEVVAIYSIGLFEYDSAVVYVPFDAATYLMALEPLRDVATKIEVKVDDDLVDQSDLVGDAIIAKLGKDKFTYRDWKVTHKTIFQALKLERLGMTIAIGLIVFVASLNIVAMLTMIVFEKSRDIATLMAMGATIAQIRRIFMLQGIIIGLVGTGIGLVLGHGLSYFADKYWLIRLDPEVYSIDHLPFSADPWDSVVIAVAAVFICFLATLYPSASAAKLQPVEALRYE
jgi:lipoprotein-releasing system permease protein